MNATTAKRQTFKSQYGRKGISISALCPTYALTSRLGRTHVGTPDEEIVAMVEEQVAKVRGTKRDDGWTPALEREAIRFALWRHHENLAEYAWVMGGH